MVITAWSFNSGRSGTKSWWREAVRLEVLEGSTMILSPSFPLLRSKGRGSTQSWISLSATCDPSPLDPCSSLLGKERSRRTPSRRDTFHDALASQNPCIWLFLLASLTSCTSLQYYRLEPFLSILRSHQDLACRQLVRSSTLFPLFPPSSSRPPTDSSSSLVSALLRPSLSHSPQLSS